jgi:hypothetical protein
MESLALEAVQAIKHRSPVPPWIWLAQKCEPNAPIPDLGRFVPQIRSKRKVLRIYLFSRLVLGRKYCVMSRNKTSRSAGWHGCCPLALALRACACRKTTQVRFGSRGRSGRNGTDPSAWRQTEEHARRGGTAEWQTPTRPGLPESARNSGTETSSALTSPPARRGGG